MVARLPCSTAPEYFQLSIQSSVGENDQKSNSDFAALGAGFIAFLVVDIPSQALWVPELAKYCFGGALVHLVASGPGVHSPRSPCSVFWVCTNGLSTWRLIFALVHCPLGQ